MNCEVDRDLDAASVVVTAINLGWASADAVAHRQAKNAWPENLRTRRKYSSQAKNRGPAQRLVNLRGMDRQRPRRVRGQRVHVCTRRILQAGASLGKRMAQAACDTLP